MAADEQVLVIERALYEELGTFHGLTFDVERYKQRLFAPHAARFMLRSQAEENPHYKQIIPYVLMTCGGKFLTYVRGKRAGEGRLVGRRSMGIGGHINPQDDMSLFDPYETYLAAVEREVAEEIDLQTSHEDTVVALLNDDSNEVGQVHLGIVHCWQLAQPLVTKREQMITQMEFLAPQELAAAAETMETWSALCVARLEKILHASNSTHADKGTAAQKENNQP